MTIEDVILQIGEIGIIPVVRAATVDDATRAVEAICAGGIPILEITMTVPNATSVIRHVVCEYGKMALVGAGTVTTAKQAEACIRAGAEFIVSPGLSIDVLSVALAAAKLAIPGALTPTELMHATDNGSRLGKAFSCGNVGVSALRAGHLAMITQRAREIVQAVHSARELALKKDSGRITA